MASGFTRQETLALTGISSGRLSYLDRTGLVLPIKFGNPKHPSVIYSWEQVLQIKTIERLRETLSLQEIRKVLDFLEKRGYEPSIFKCQLALIGSELYLIEDWEEFGKQVLKVSGKNKGQVAIQSIGSIGDVISDLWKEAEDHHILDFEKRTQGTPLAHV